MSFELKEPGVTAVILGHLPPFSTNLDGFLMIRLSAAVGMFSERAGNATLSRLSSFHSFTELPWPVLA